MKNLLEKIHNRCDKVSCLVFEIITYSVKILFWLIFVCLFLLQTLIILNIWQDMPIEMGNAYKAIALHVFLTVCLVISIFTKKKIFSYIFASGMIILFLYLSSLPDLSSYFGYFDGLD